MENTVGCTECQLGVDIEQRKVDARAALENILTSVDAMSLGDEKFTCVAKLAILDWLTRDVLEEALKYHEKVAKTMTPVAEMLKAMLEAVEEEDTPAQAETPAEPKPNVILFAPPRNPRVN